MAFGDFSNVGGIGLPQSQPFNYTSLAPVPQGPGSTFDPSQVYGAGTSAYGGIGALSNFNLTDPTQAGNITQGLINNPGAPSWLAGAQTASGMGQQAGVNAFNAGGGLMGAGGNLMALGGPIVGAAFDPQNALYARTLQQVQDQTRAANMAAGVGTSPWGAGLENWGINNFNIDWQNNQLGRMAQGAGAVGNLYGQGGNLIGAGAGMQAGAVPTFYNASGLPYQTGQTIGSNAFGALANLQGYGAAGANQLNQQIQDYMNFQQLGGANALSNYYAALSGQGQGYNQALQGAQYTSNMAQQQFQDAMAQAQAQWNQNQQAWSGIGKIAGTVGGFALGGLPGAAIGGSMFGPGGTSTGGGGNPYYAGMNTQPFAGLFSGLNSPMLSGSPAASMPSFGPIPFG